MFGKVKIKITGETPEELKKSANTEAIKAAFIMTGYYLLLALIVLLTMSAFYYLFTGENVLSDSTSWFAVLVGALLSGTYHGHHGLVKQYLYKEMYKAGYILEKDGDDD